jgi:flagellar hook-associated protein 3 FlgL
MRVTQRSETRRFINDINNTYGRVNDLESQVATGYCITKGSDDPQGASAILRYKTLLADNTQYSTNTDNATSMLQETSSTLDTFSDILSSIKSIVASASTADDSTALAAYGDSVDQYLDELVSLANTQYNGKYIFGGTNTQDQPFTLSSDGESVTANASGITGTISLPIGDGLSQITNIDGQEAFDGTSIFSTIISIRDSFQSGNVPSDTDQTALKDAYNHVVGESSKAGLYVENLENNSTYLSSQNTEITSLLSGVEDTDTTTAYTKEQTALTNLQSALAVAAKALPMSLLDYLS